MSQAGNEWQPPALESDAEILARKRRVLPFRGIEIRMADRLMELQKTDYDRALEELNRLLPGADVPDDFSGYREPVWLRFLRWLVKVL